jgi:NAD(P)-dependent dehydrogenase (short-subunit alcohol dehydrogenase family)
MTGAEADLTGRVALITGGGTGIGEGIAVAFGAAGISVAVVGRRPEPLEQTVESVAAAGGTAIALPADVTRYDDLAAAVDTAVAELGLLDIVVSNAGGPSAFGATLDMAPDEWAATVDVNLNGHWNTAKATVPKLRERGGGHLIFVGSSTSYIPESGVVAYGAAKAGVSLLRQALAVELRADQIAVNELVPGMVRTAAIGMVDGETPQIVLDHVAQVGEWLKDPEDVATLALYMVSLPKTGTTGQVFNLGVNRT